MIRVSLSIYQELESGDEEEEVLLYGTEIGLDALKPEHAALILLSAQQQMFFANLGAKEQAQSKPVPRLQLFDVWLMGTSGSLVDVVKQLRADLKLTLKDASDLAAGRTPVRIGIALEEVHARKVAAVYEQVGAVIEVRPSQSVEDVTPVREQAFSA